MDIDKNLNNFFNEDFWDNPKETQLTLPEAHKPERLRDIHRDFKVINKAQQWEKKLFLKILDCAIQTINIPNGYKGTGRPSIPLSEKLKICCIKQYNLKGARRTVYDIEYAKTSGFLFVPTISENYFNRINEYLRDESLTPYLQKLIQTLSEPLIHKEHFFAIDGTGFKIATGKIRYKDIRTDKKAKGGYIGLHIIAGIKSKIIPHAIASKGYEHDNNFFKPLVSEANKIFEIKELYADGAYFSQKNFNLCHSLKIKAYIKPREDAILKKFGNSVWNNSIDRYMNDLEKGDERRYTLRANVECAFHMIKSVFSDVLRHKTFEGRINELLSRIVCHNIRCLVYAYFKEDIKFPFSMSS